MPFDGAVTDGPIAGAGGVSGPVVIPSPPPLPQRHDGTASQPAARPGPAPTGAAEGPGGVESGERAPDVSASAIAHTTELLNRILDEMQRRLKFNVHDGTGRIWVQVIDTSTQEVIKEIPPERYLDMVARIWELVGLLVDERA